MEIALSNRVIARNSLGRFIADCTQAGHDTVETLVERGSKMSSAMAPRRTGALSGSIYSKMLSRTSGVWIAPVHYALHQEFGTSPHAIHGSPFLHFFWENEGRWFQPGIYGGVTGGVDVVWHPGHGPQPYLRPAYEAIMAQAMAVAHQKYPG